MYQPHEGSSSAAGVSPGRLFVALPVAAAQREWLLARGREARRQQVAGHLRWVPPQNLHLTLRFLGDTAPDKLPMLAEALARVAMRHSAPELVPGRPLILPSPARARVLGVSIGPVAPLREMAATLDEALAGAGWPPRTRPLVPHITLARLGRGRQPRAALLTKLLPDAWPQSPPVALAPSVQLWRSDLAAEGAVYTVEQEYALQAPAPRNHATGSDRHEF